MSKQGGNNITIFPIGHSDGPGASSCNNSINAENRKGELIFFVCLIQETSPSLCGGGEGRFVVGGKKLPYFVLHRWFCSRIICGTNIILHRSIFSGGILLKEWMKNCAFLGNTIFTWIIFFINTWKKVK